MGFEETFLDREHGGFAQLPFDEQLGVHDGVVCFASDTEHAAFWRNAREDLAEVRSWHLDVCYYGAANYAIWPFAATIQSKSPLTAAAVLRALRVRNFGSEHVSSLDVSELPHTGYRPGTANDEIHTDGKAQVLFYVPGDKDVDDDLEGEDLADARASAEAHEALRALVDGPLFYVLLHEDGGQGCSLVALFAVGRSRRGAHLVGVASQQRCLNLCD